MRAAWIAGVICVSCGGKAAPPPPADMPLPPTRAEAERAGTLPGDGNLHVHGISPDHGSETGGEAIRIRGSNFRIAKRVFVKFGDRPVDVLRVADDEIDVQAPPGSGVVDVIVLFEPGGELKLPAAYTYFAP